MNIKLMSPSAQSLDGIWRVRQDCDNIGLREGWANGLGDGPAHNLRVPGSLCTLPGEPEGIFWYEQTFAAQNFITGNRAWLTFGSVEYQCEVFVNGTSIGAHEGKQAAFTLEATHAIREGAENLLIVRVVYPNQTVVDGIDGRDILGLNGGGGIQQHVVFTVTQSHKILSAHVHGNIKTGCVDVSLDCDGDDGGSVEIEVTGPFHGAQSTRTAMEHTYDDESAVQISVPIETPLFWSCETPHLYSVTIRLYTPDGVLSDAQTIRTGFRDFRVSPQGYFTLNGKRVYLKCAHGATLTPFSVHSDPRALALNRHYIAAMKAAGFNCVRFLTGTPASEILDLCDEIGLMVYQEPPFSWMPGGRAAVLSAEDRQPTGEVERRYINALKNMLLQDRNHPSIVIWGLLNETVYCRRYLAALSALPLIRSLDRTRMVLLSSGSWDQDLKNGSVCNPYSDVWECLWGKEGTNHNSLESGGDEQNRRKAVTAQEPFSATGYYSGAGDIHIYPCAQVNTGLFQWMKEVGADSKPVFLSEYGVGSQYDYYALSRFMESVPDTPEHHYARELGNYNDALLKRFIKNYQLQDLYPCPRDVILDSYAEQAKYREQAFSMIRANPQIIGYSMTAVQDHGFAGEGFIGLLGEFKPGQMDVMQDGWAGLRWCLLTNPTHCYAGNPIELRAVLANEDVLAPGTYPVTLRIHNDAKILWSHRTHVTITAGTPGSPAPLAVPVFEEVLVIPGLTGGKWTFSAELKHGGFARGGRVDFDITDKASLPTLNCRVQVAGDIPDPASMLLKAQGAELSPFPSPEQPGVILVGALSDADTWNQIYDQIAAGAQAVFLNPYSTTDNAAPFKLSNEKRDAVNLRRNDGSSARLIGNCEWLYHRIAVGKPSPLTGGLRATRMLDQNYYNNVLSQIYFDLDSLPDESAVLAFTMKVRCSAGNDELQGVLLGHNHFGKGGYSFNTLDITSYPGHPAADRLLVNLIADAHRRSRDIPPPHAPTG